MGIKQHHADNLIEKLWQAMEQLREAEFPRLSLETLVGEEGEHYEALWCPRCEEQVDLDDLYAVDFAERWTSADPLENIDIIAGTVTFCFDGSSEFGSSLYYRHDNHGVSLPIGWTEESR